jgi:hypothetical protein
MLSLEIAYQPGEKILPGMVLAPREVSQCLGRIRSGIEQVFANREDLRGIPKKHFSCFSQPGFLPVRSKKRRRGTFREKGYGRSPLVGYEEIIGGSGKTLQSSDLAERFEMTKIDDEGVLLHHDSNLNTSVQKQEKIDFCSDIQ